LNQNDPKINYITRKAKELGLEESTTKTIIEKYKLVKSILGVESIEITKTSITDKDNEHADKKEITIPA